MKRSYSINGGNVDVGALIEQVLHLLLVAANACAKENITVLQKIL